MKLVTKQVLKDYEKVQSKECLKLWVDNSGCCKDEELLKLPLGCALSDIDSELSNMVAERDYCCGEELQKIQTRIRSAKAFLKKYTKDASFIKETNDAFAWYDSKMGW